MRIDRLELQNFRCFEKFSIDLRGDFNVLVGINGTGKTALMDALAIALSSLFYGFEEGPQPLTIALTDVRTATFVHNGQLDIQSQLPASIACAATLGKHSISWSRRRTTTIRERTRKADIAAIERYGTSLKTAARAGKPVILPILAYLGTGRLWVDKAKRFSKATPTAKALEKVLSLKTRAQGYVHCMDPASSFVHQTEWIQKQTYTDLQEGTPSPLLAAVESAVCSCLPELRRFYFSIRHYELFVEKLRSDGKVEGQPFEQLSDGYRSIGKLAADLAWRAVVLNPALGAAAPRETPGVVLIDEIDQSLHPTWQRRVVEDLRRTFPAIQFVVTTHSPQIISSLPAESVFLLEGDEEPTHPAFTRHRDTNAILRQVMHATERDSQTELRIHELFRLIDRDQLQEALALIDALQADLGPDDSDLIRARALIDLLRP